ncbi:MAG: four-carbon acid sugar kinase family protein, partial [Janthinobacterium lividum]
MPDLLIIADDLSGAAESAGALRLRTSRRNGSVHLVLWPGVIEPGCGDVVLDLDSRHLPAEVAGARVLQSLRRVGARVVVKKVDSLLRGDLVAEF